VRTITQNGTTSTYTLDTAGRRAVEETGPAGGAVATRVKSHFTDSSDNPSWVEKTADGATTTSRYLESLGGDLSATLVGGALTLALTNPHGDTVTTVTVPSTGPATGIDAWNSYDEYGNPTTGTVGAAPLKASSGVGYGWVGEKQRATNTTGLILMGARVYNTTTGTFTSMDPVAGGNSTSYTYPQDPVNAYDLNGNCPGCHWIHKHHNAIFGGIAVGAGILSLTPVCPGVCAGIAAGASAINAYYDVRDKDYVGAAMDVAGVGLYGGGLRASKLVRTRGEGYKSLIGKKGSKRVRHRAGRNLGRAQRAHQTAERADRVGNAAATTAYAGAVGQSAANGMAERMRRRDS
jgi:RHS repeat-associated protein